MDHLHGNIKNIANRKTALPPLFGALSFCTVTKDQIYQGDDGESTFRRCRVVTVTAGALTHPEHIFQGANPAGRRMELQVGLFEFQAFEHKVCFSELVDDLAALVGHYDTVVKADQEAELRDFARKQNLDEEKIVNEHLGSLMITMDIEFN